MTAYHFPFDPRQAGCDVMLDNQKEKTRRLRPGVALSWLRSYARLCVRTGCLVRSNRRAQNDQIRAILRQVEAHGGWTRWMGELEGFREALARYKRELYRVPLPDDHVVDHQVYGYYAPLDLKAYGFDGVLRTPAEQIMELARDFEERGVRFLFVALPCKEAVESRRFVEPRCIPVDGVVIPQWRKALMEIMLGGVEVVDAYPVLREHAMGGRPLYNESHQLAPFGLELVARETAKRLLDCCGEERLELVPYTAHYRYPWFGADRSWAVNGVRGRREERAPRVVTFGDCNNDLYHEFARTTPQGVRNLPTDFASHLSYRLGSQVEYIGRYLPYLEDEGVDRMPPGALSGVRAAVFVGFVSSAFVDLGRAGACWCVSRVPDEAFHGPRPELHEPWRLQGRLVPT